MSEFVVASAEFGVDFGQRNPWQTEIEEDPIAMEPVLLLAVGLEEPALLD